MRLITRLSLPVLAAMTLAVPVATRPSPDAQRFWPEWRGPLGTGEAPQATPPREWSTTRNVAWKVQVPGIGKSSPIVWGDLVIVTTAVPKDDSATPELEWTVLAYGRADGAVKWRRVVRTGRPHEGHHKDGTFASGSALTDGTRVYALSRLARSVRARHEGRGGLAEGPGPDADAQRIWRRQLGDGLRRHPRPHVGPRGRRLRRGLRHGHRQGALATVARRADDLGNAPRRGARRQAASRRQRHQPAGQLRPGDGHTGVADRRHDAQRHPLAGLRQRHGLRDGWIPRQLAEGDQARRGQGRRSPARPPSRSPTIATLRTCHRRCSTKAGCTF